MPTCEWCWARADGDQDEYAWLVKTSTTCTPERQAGPDATECPMCGRKAVHQHAKVCMYGCRKEVPHSDAG